MLENIRFFSCHAVVSNGPSRWCLCLTQRRHGHCPQGLRRILLFLGFCSIAWQRKNRTIFCLYKSTYTNDHLTDFVNALLYSQQLPCVFDKAYLKKRFYLDRRYQKEIRTFHSHLEVGKYKSFEKNLRTPNPKIFSPKSPLVSRSNWAPSPKAMELISLRIFSLIE